MVHRAKGIQHSRASCAARRLPAPAARYSRLAGKRWQDDRAADRPTPHRWRTRPRRHERGRDPKTTATVTGVEVTLVELKDIQLPESMKRAMARQAEAEREKRAKIIAAEGESMAAAALGDASDTMMAHPLALQLRNLQTLIDLGVDKNTTVVFPAPLMSAIGELGAFLARESAAAASMTTASPDPESARPAPTGSAPNSGDPRPAGDQTAV